MPSKFFNRENPYLIQFAVLGLVGFWYIDSRSKWLRSFYAVYRFFAFFLLTILMFIEIVDVMMLGSDTSKLAERLCAATVTIIITTRAHLMLRYSKKLYGLQEHLSQFREMRSEHPKNLEIIRKSSEQIVMLVKVLYVGAVVGVLFWSFHQNLYESRKLPFPIRLPIDVEKSPYYEVLYVYLTLVLIMFTGSVVSAILGFGSYLIIVNSHFEILKENIESIRIEREEVVKESRYLAEFSVGRFTRKKFRKGNDREAEEKRLKDEKTMAILKDVIESQKFIYKEVESFNRLHSKHLLVHIMGILFGVAVIETTGMSDDFTIHLVKRLLILGLGIIDMFSICFFGEELQYKSIKIANALYMIPWHEMDTKVQKLILVMSIRSQRPCILKAGGTIRLNLATFLNIMRVAYNFVLLLRRSAVQEHLK